MKYLLKTFVLMFLFLKPVYAASDCGKVSIADMNWASATLFANIDKFILKHGYGCDVELVAGDTTPTGTSMIEKGEPDIAPELWANSFIKALEKGVEEKRLRKAGTPLPDGGEEGFWVPKYMVDKNPELATIKGIIKNKKLFPHPEDKSKSAFYGCPAGWNCQITSENLFRALKLKDKNFEIVAPGSGAALAGSIAKSYERGKGWFGYYWAPTALLGKYKMVKVDFEAKIDKDHFEKCISKADCKNPKITMYPPSPIYTVTTEAFAKKAPKAFKYLQSRGLTNAETNALLAWKEDNQADGSIAAEYFFKNYKDTWKKWLDKDIAAKIEAAIK